MLYLETVIIVKSFHEVFMDSYGKDEENNSVSKLTILF